MRPIPGIVDASGVRYSPFRSSKDDPAQELEKQDQEVSEGKKIFFYLYDRAKRDVFFVVIRKIIILSFIFTKTRIIIFLIRGSQPS